MEKQLLLQTKNLTPSRPDFEILGVFNPAVIQIKDETILIARVAESVIQTDPQMAVVPFYRDHSYHFIKIPRNSPDHDFSDSRVIKNHCQNYLTSISHFAIGRSRDGVSFTFNDKERIFPDSRYEEYGIEDPRITLIDGRYYITYAAVSQFGINVGLMVTDDFRKFERLGLILPFDNKDCVIFPSKINGHYVALHRPSSSNFGKLDIWTAESNDLRTWGNHHVLTEARVHYGDSDRVGAGAIPFLTDKGWVVVYHSADEQQRYHITAMVLDKDNPAKVLMKSKKPLIQPTEDYETKGFVNNVVFTCGLTHNENNLTVYYGACDQNIAKCTMSMKELWENMEVVA